MQEELYCEVGGHSWGRESKRGRKPRNCPEHTPVKDEIKIITSVKKDIEKALPDVESFEDSLDRLVPGISTVLQQEKMRELWCEFGDGHSYEEVSRRGRLPRFCAAHRAAGIGANSVKVTISPEKKEEAQRKLQETLARHQARVTAAEAREKAAKTDLDKIWPKICDGADLSKLDEEIDIAFHRANMGLLAEIIALRSIESRLENI